MARRQLYLYAASLTLVLTPLAYSVPAESAKPATTLQVSPVDYFVGGQAQTFAGRLGSKANRPIWLEYHMNRPGDVWTMKEGTRSKTMRGGKYEITVPAPSMFGISYRVASKRFKTQPQMLSASSQELIIWTGEDKNASENMAIDPVVNEPFTVIVDTTPELKGREDLTKLPVFENRKLTLQKKTEDNRWLTIATSVVEKDGKGYFTNVIEEESGKITYQVRQERIFTDKNRIGWRASFPLAINVLPAGSVARPAQTYTILKASPGERGTPSRPKYTASKHYGWGPSVFDFSWERGEDLNVRPARGTVRKGYWTSYSDGSGRASQLNGGANLASSVTGRAQTGDFGTTRMTLKNNSLKFGRWETRARWQTLESAEKDYMIKFELVPENTDPSHCNVPSIVIGHIRPRGNELVIGAAKNGKYWRKTIIVPGLESSHPNIGAEVAKRHVTWFVNGDAVATMKTKKPFLNSALTLRLSLEGSTDKEHNSIRVFSDWQRAFTLAKGKKMKVSERLTSSSESFC